MWFWLVSSNRFRQGELAVALADLVKEVWRPSSSSGSAVSPKQLKHVIGRFAPQFQGYQQHDAHELLAFLLDGVHEDLNRVLEKPFVDLDADHLAKELDDKQRARVFWSKHEQRNQSVIVDLFHAQLRSTSVCPAPTAGGCGRQSVTYDAFAYLSLPLPGLASEKRFIEVALVRDPSLEHGAWFCEMPIKYSVESQVADGIVNVVESLVGMAASDPAQRNAMEVLANGTNTVILTEQFNYKVQREREELQFCSRRTGVQDVSGGPVGVHHFVSRAAVWLLPSARIGRDAVHVHFLFARQAARRRALRLRVAGGIWAALYGRVPH